MRPTIYTDLTPDMRTKIQPIVDLRREIGRIDTEVEGLKAQGCKVAVYDGFKGEPKSSDIDAATELAVGIDASCALQNGFILCWGMDEFGQIGNGVPFGAGTYESVPAPIGGQ